MPTLITLNRHEDLMLAQGILTKWGATPNYSYLGAAPGSRCA